MQFGVPVCELTAVPFRAGAVHIPVGQVSLVSVRELFIQTQKVHASLAW